MWFFKQKLKPNLFLLNWAPSWVRRSERASAARVRNNGSDSSNANANEADEEAVGRELEVG